MQSTVRAALALIMILSAGVGSAFGVDAKVPEEWKALDGSGLKKLAWQLYQKGDGAKEDRRRLANHVTETYTTNTSTVRGMEVAHWAALAYTLAKDMPKESRSLWADRIQSAFLGNGLELSEYQDLWRAIAQLSPGRMASFSASLLNDTKVWKAWPLPQLTGAARAVASKKDARSERTLLRLTRHITRTHVADPQAARKVDCFVWYEWAVILRKRLDPPTRKVWIAGLRKAFVGQEDAGATAAPDEIRHLSNALR